MLTFIRNKQNQWEQFKADLKVKNTLHFHIVDTVEVIVVALCMALVFRHFVLQTSKVPSGSMIPTLQIGDRLFVNKFIYRFGPPHRGDIVVFNSPFNDGVQYVKRCVALPNDTIEVRHGEIYINGTLEVFPGINIQNDDTFYGPKKIPADSYFMMGDNRGNSYDSRYWGVVSRKDILGKAVITIWPIPRMQVLH